MRTPTVQTFAALVAASSLLHCSAARPTAGDTLSDPVGAAGAAPGDAPTPPASLVTCSSRIRDASPSPNAPVGLDLTFNGVGYVTGSNLSALAGGELPMVLNGVALDSAGRVLVGGTSWLDIWKGYATVLRFESDGANDLTFGTCGAFSKTKTLSSPTFGFDTIEGFALGAGDRILASGRSEDGGHPQSGVVVKSYHVAWNLSPGGALDTAFNGTGFTGRSSTSGGSTPYEAGLAIREAGGGAVFVAGRSYRSSGPQAIVWKYTDAGALDTAGFNPPNGWVSTLGIAGAPAAAADDAGLTLVVDAAGRPVVGGRSALGPSNTQAAVVWRFTADGTPDTTFNATGAVVLANVTTDIAATHGKVTGVVIDGAGNIVVAGESKSSNGDQGRGWVVRLTPAGALDTTFGAGGKVTLAPARSGGQSQTAALALDAHGRILVAGDSHFDRASSGGSSVAVWRLTPSGALDTTFATAGAFVMTDTAPHGAKGFGNISSDFATSIVVDAADRPVVAGASNGIMAVWRLMP